MVGKTQKLLIVGDLNSNLLQPSLPQTRVLVVMMKHINLTELVGQPTRVTSSSSSQIDIILSNVPDDFCDSTVVPCSCTDHYIILSHYYARGLKTGGVPIRLYFFKIIVSWMWICYLIFCLMISLGMMCSLFQMWIIVCTVLP